MSEKHSITRELIENGGLRQAYQRLTSVASWSDEQIDQSVDEVMSRIRPDAGIWIFGYGSLLWNPCFDVRDRRLATLYGRHRCLRLLSRFARGTDRAPGLLLTLAPGGSCAGLALRIGDDDPRRELTNLWRREMLTGSYRPRLMTVRTEPGPIAAIVFDGNLTPPYSCEPMSLADELTMIKRASGFGGSNADYVLRTHRALLELGIHDAHLAALSKALTDDPAAIG